MLESSECAKTSYGAARTISNFPDAQVARFISADAFCFAFVAFYGFNWPRFSK